MEDLISHEEGARFQRLAIVLAKRRWPEFIASERKKDLGADAYAKALLAPDGRGKALACSLTATLAKIRRDAAEIQKHFEDVNILVFATPKPVTKYREERWRTEIQRDFGYDLVVMSREEIVTSLMDPVNAAVCATHLRIRVEVEQDLATLIDSARHAASEVVVVWADRTKGEPLIDLRAAMDSTDATELRLADLNSALLQGRRIVLEAPAGRGKTTTLTQMALLLGAAGRLAFLVDFPAWVRSRTDILQFISGMTPFRSRALDPQALARVSTAVHCSFLLNGWNEVVEEYSGDALGALRELERNFPAAGIIVATRSHFVAPPLLGAMRTTLLLISRSDRHAYLQRRLGTAGDALRERLDHDPTLDALTRTPFILSRLAAVFESSNLVPTTKMGVLGAVVQLLEHAGEHESHLKMPPLIGHAREYLTSLAEAVTTEADVTISDQRARQIVSATSLKLRDGGQVANVPEPSSVVNTLCAHHVLERVEYPETVFRFEHQQFQEFYAALRVRDRLRDLGESSEGVLDFTRTYVNEPAWGEPLRMVAEEIGNGDGQGLDIIRAGKQLIEMASQVDLIFAADLTHLCGASVWVQVRDRLENQLRAWYSVDDENHRQCAVAAMMATGSESFADVIIPLLSHQDQQIRLRSHRAFHEFHTSSLGPQWQCVVSSWSEQARMDFVLEMLHSHSYDEDVVSFALRDPSVKVRAAATEALAWFGSSEDIAQGLTALDERSFREVVQKAHADSIPAAWRAKAIDALQTYSSDSPDATERIRLLLKSAELGAVRPSERLRPELDRLERAKIHEAARFLILPALNIIWHEDDRWVSEWVATRMADGSLWGDDWGKFLGRTPADLKNRLLTKLETEDFKHARTEGIVSVLVARADVDMVRRVFAKLRELHRTIAAAPSERHDYEWAIQRQLAELMMAIPADIAVSGVLGSVTKGWNPLEFRLVAHLFSGVAQPERDRDQLSDDSREALRAYLRDGVPFVLKEEDFQGDLKADLASSLAQVGESDDIELMRQLILADIERVRRGRAARAAGDRTARSEGAVMSYASWHVRAVTRLKSQRGTALLIDLLSEPEYEADAAAALAASLPEGNQVEGAAYKKDYASIWEARARVVSGRDEDARNLIVTAIRNRIQTLMRDWKSAGNTFPYDHRLKELAKALAVADPRDSADLILDVMALSGDRSGGWQERDALETLLFSGAPLPTRRILEIVDPVLQRVRARLWQDNQQIWLAKSLLCILPFVDSPVDGIRKIRQQLSDLKIPGYELRDLLLAIGHSRCPEGLDLLRELTPTDPHRAEQLADAWLMAVSALNTPESRRLLLGSVDPDLFDGSYGAVVERHDIMAAHIVNAARGDVEITRRLFDLCEIELQPRQRLVLSAVVARLGTLGALLAGLKLVDDTAVDPVPFDLWSGLESAFVEQRPYGNSGYAFSLVPRDANQIRSKLLEMATNDARRRKSASKLLGQIEVWRLEHGRPPGEPRHPALDTGAPWPAIQAFR